MTSLQQMIAKLTGLIDTKDVSPWENQFLKSIQEKQVAGAVVRLSDNQIAKVEELHSKHFG